jgi:hypothetical protein
MTLFLSSERSEFLPRPSRGEADVRLRAAGEGPNFLRFQVCGATDNRAAQMSLHPNPLPTNGRGNWKEGEDRE